MGKTMVKKLDLKDKKQPVYKHNVPEQISLETIDYIYKSENYDDFVFIKGNRTIRNSNLLRIIGSMKKNFVKNPIFVKVMENGKLGIIDGQHRYLACKELGKPIYYIIQENVNVNTIPDINISSTWTDWDFVKSFADQGIEDYQKIIELSELYPELKFTKVYLIIAQSKVGFYNKNKIYESDIRSGTFKFKDFEKAKETCEKLMDFKICKTDFKNSPWGKNSFFTSILKLFTLPSSVYDHKRMIDKIKSNQQLIVKQNTIKEYARNFSIVYNYRATNKVYFENYI